MPKSLPQEGHPSKPGRSGLASTSGEIREAPLLAITREGPWLWTACYQLRAWPRRLDSSVPSVFCFVAVRKRAPPDWVLEEPRVLCHPSVSLTIQLKFHSAQGRQAWTEAERGLAQEVPEGPAMGPCPITPTRSWNVFDFSSQAYMCLPSDTMLAVILARKHVWCSHPTGGGWGGTAGTEFQANQKQKKISDYYTQHSGSAVDNSKSPQSALFLYTTF